MSEPDRPSHSHHFCPHCQVKTSSPAAVDLEKSDSPSHHPSQFLSRQSRRAFLTSLGAATALGTNMIGFRRDSQAAKAQTQIIADSIRDAGNIHTLKATPETCF